MVAKTIGTKVSFAWEVEAGKRPTSGYEIWCDCTSHPDFNPAPDQVETTTLCEPYMHTYEDGLVDFGNMEFGSNMTVNTYNIILGSSGFATLYEAKTAANLRLWVCVDIAGFNKSFFVPVKPQSKGFGLPSGEAGSNKYDLVVRFMPAEAMVSNSDGAGWYDDPTYASTTNHTLTITGYDSASRIKVLDTNNIVVRDIETTTEDTSVTLTLPAGKYEVIATVNSSLAIDEADLTSANDSIEFGA